MEIKRNAELTIRSLLASALPAVAFYPSRGMATNPTPVPPYGIIIIDKAEKTIPNKQIHLLTGQVIYVTRADATDATAHGNIVKQIYDSVIAIENGVDPETGIIVHGVSVLSTGQYVDEARQARGDIVVFTMGVTDVN